MSTQTTNVSIQDFASKLGGLTSLNTPSALSSAGQIKALNTPGIDMSALRASVQQKGPTFGQKLTTSPGLQQGLGAIGSIVGGLSGNDLDPTVKNTREGIRSAISAIPGYGPLIAAATGAVDALGDITGLNLDQIDKDSAKRAGVNTTFNNIINAIPGLSSSFGIFAKRTNEMDAKSMGVDQLANAYGGTSADINAAADLSGKRILGGRKDANSFISKQNARNSLIDNIYNESLTKDGRLANAQNILSKNQKIYMGGRQNMAVGKRGMKLPSVYEIRQLLEIKKFADGGKMNVIVEGAYHSRKNHLSDINPELEDVTPKGIPVITKDEGGEIVQTAEVEQKEMILHLELTEKLEALWKDGSEEAMIEAGKLLAEEIINNTDDKTGEVLDNE